MMDEFRSEQAQKAIDRIATLFMQLKEEGMDPIYINALAMGMIRRSMESLVGRGLAEEWDQAARDRIGWR